MRAFALLVAAAALVPSGAAGAGSQPLVGANYTHYMVQNCSLDDGGIVAFGRTHRALIRAELSAMRTAGLSTLRALLWHMHEPGPNIWGVVRSAGGRLGADERSNLSSLISMARAAGFAHMEIALGPSWTNGIGFPVNNYDPSLFEENWEIAQDVHAIAEAAWPDGVRYDLLNEGAPSSYSPDIDQLSKYVVDMYTRWVDKYGNKNVTISSIVAWNDQSRIENLIHLLKGTGRPLPTWFEIHAGGPRLFDDLRATERTLDSEGLSQPLVLGETSYDDPVGAAEMKRYVATSSRLLEVMEWPLRWAETCNLPPPYRAPEYLAALGAPTPALTLSGSLDAATRTRLVTSTGTNADGVYAGTYTVTVADKSKQAEFAIVGRGVAARSGVRFKGTRIWRLALRPGTYRYGVGPKPKSTLVVFG